MSKVYYYRLRCTTEATDVFEWRTEAQGPPTVCPNNGSDTIDTDSITIIGEKERKEVLFQGALLNDNKGDAAAMKILDDGTSYLSFMVPFDFITLVSLDLIISTTAAFTSKVIKLYSDYGSVTELTNQHSESNTTITFTAGAGTWEAFDVSSVFSTLSANDVCGLKVKPTAVGTGFKTVGIRMIYEVI